MTSPRYVSAITNLSWLALAGLWVYTVLSVLEMPETVPVHFGAGGEPDNFGSRYTYLVMPAIATAILGLFRVIKRYPQHLNYPVAITPENGARQKALAFGLLSTIGFVIQLIFSYVIYSTNKYLQDGSMDFSILLFLSIAFIPVLIYMYLAYKAR